MCVFKSVNLIVDRSAKVGYKSMSCTGVRVLGC